MNEAAPDQGSTMQNDPKVEALEIKLNDLVLALTGQNQCSTTREAYACTVPETLTAASIAVPQWTNQPSQST